MDLNQPGSGKKLIQKVMKQGNLKNMRWTREQQREALKKQKNAHTPKTRNQSR